MSFLSSFPLAVTAGVLVLLLVGLALVFSRLYMRATKEQAFVRTGFGGETVIMDGGALVFPILHEVIPVNMNTLRLEVSRRQTMALITKDRMRVDVTAEFYVRVGKSAENVSNAAQTLGRKTLNPEELKALVEGKFVDALRSVASSMDMDELHEQRPEFVSKVQDSVKTDLSKNGLELETVSLTGLDQTPREYFNEDNAFDAEGLTKLTEQIETLRKKRNDVEQDNRVQIEAVKAEADKKQFTIQQDRAIAEIEQKKAIEERRSQTEAEIAKKRAADQFISEEAEIERERRVEEARLAKQRAVEIANQDNAITIADKSREEAAANAEANKARALAVKAEEEVSTVREVARAERQKQIALTKAAEEAEKGAVEIRISAEAEKAAAIDRADAIRIAADAESKSDTVRAEGIKALALAEAEGLRAKNDAENALSAEAMKLRQGLALISEMANIIRESVRPMERIDSIKIVDLGKVAGNGNGGSTSDAGVSGADRISNAALNYRMNAPLVDSLLNEIGLAGGLGQVMGGSAVSELAGLSNPAKSSASATETPSSSKTAEQMVMETSAPMQTDSGMNTTF